MNNTVFAFSFRAVKISSKKKLNLMHDEPGNVGGAWTANSKMLFCSIFQELIRTN